MSPTMPVEVSSEGGHLDGSPPSAAGVRAGRLAVAKSDRQIHQSSHGCRFQFVSGVRVLDRRRAHALSAL
jgi:hypothetical protein